MIVELIIFGQIERFGPDEMGEQVLISDEIINFIADGTSFSAAYILMSIKIGSKVEIERSVDVFILFRMQVIGSWFGLID